MRIKNLIICKKIKYICYVFYECRVALSKRDVQNTRIRLGLIPNTLGVRMDLKVNKRRNKSATGKCTHFSFREIENCARSTVRKRWNLNVRLMCLLRKADRQNYDFWQIALSDSGDK